MQDWKFRPARDLGLPAGERLKSLQRESGLASTVGHLAWWAGVRGYLALYHRLKVVGRGHLPAEGPYVLVANHASHLDALALAAPLPWRLRDRTFPIAAGDVFFDTPLTSLFAARLLNALPMWRKGVGRHALDELRGRLVEDACVFVLFPEGTRSRDGAMSSFRFGLGRLVAGAGVPVVPCHLTGCHRAWPPTARWPRPRPLSLRIGAPLDFADTADDRAGWLHVAAESERAVRALAEAG